MVPARGVPTSCRFFQRPDRRGGGNGLFTGRLDPTLTSMRGYGAYARVARDAGDWQWEAALNVRSPGFENNDIAFLTRTDFIWMNANVQRSWTRPTAGYRQLWITAGAQQEYNFDGDLTQRQFHGHAFIQLPFYWSLSAFRKGPRSPLRRSGRLRLLAEGHPLPGALSGPAAPRGAPGPALGETGTGPWAGGVASAHGVEGLPLPVPLRQLPGQEAMLSS